MATLGLPDNQPLPDIPTSSWLARNRRFVILGAALLFVGAVAAVLLTRSPSPVAVSNQANSAGTSTTTSSNRPTFQRFPTLVRNDKDGDGLTDDEEQQAQTNPTRPDTDGDGLTDYEEVKIYKTNPLQQDTDGDKVPDGQEVAAGTNPAGSGNLRDVSQAIRNLNSH